MNLNDISTTVRGIGAFLASLTIIIGFIIWLAQLNWYALQSAAQLSILMEDVKMIRQTVTQHHIESEKWKEKIRQLELTCIRR